jgi:DNA (cytosine-5)-methyltransferase 1
MIRNQFTLDLNDELIVDNFAGGGGASTGIEMALGRHVDHAINHDRFALGMHRINHPQTVHHHEDVFDVDPETVCEGRPVGLCHNSPDCKHFSKAKGGKPLDKRIRGLVLVMLKWAKYGARVLTMENVEEIVTWGPLIRVKKRGEWGWYADPKHAGRTWQAFLSILSTGIDPDHPDLPEILEVLGGYVTKEECVRGFGYTYEARQIRACDVGTPTIRKRLYMIARCDGRPIVWPETTHAPRSSTSGLKPFRTIAECIDWDRPCPSIFLNKREAKRWRCKRPLARSSLRRIAKGIYRYVMNSAEPFIISAGSGSVAPAMMQTGHFKSNSAMVKGANEPMRTQATAASHALVAAKISGTLIQTGYGERDGQAPRTIDPRAPGLTSVAGGCKQAAVVAHLMTNTTGHSGAAVDEFCPTIATLIHTAHGEQDKNGRKRGRGAHDVHEAMPAALASPDCALAAAHMVKLRGNPETHAPGHDLREPGHTISTGGNHGIVAASIVRQFGASVGQEVDTAGPTVMPGGGGKTGVIAAHLTKFCTGSVGQSVSEPGPTVTAGSHSPETHGGAATPNGMVAAYLAQHNGGEVGHQTIGHDARDPFSTISSKGSQQQVVEASIAIMTPEQVAGARRVAKFLRDHGVEFEGEFATVAGYVIVDIGMRMLAPRELFRAQGFSDAYVIDRAWVIDPETGAIEEVCLTKEQQIRMCGNSVCPPVMAAIVVHNVPELSRRRYSSDRVPALQLG